MQETEHKFLLTRPHSEIEREAGRKGTLKSRRLLQQRYFDPKGRKIHLLKLRDEQGGVRHAFRLTVANGSKLSVAVDAAFFEHLSAFCREVGPCDGDEPRILCKLRLLEVDRWTIRIRRSTDMSGMSAKHVLTLKKPVTAMTCEEPECDISRGDHDAFARHCGPALRKRRICVRYGRRTWELDLFGNDELEGLSLAEVELPSEDAEVRIPPWAGRDVTEDPAYRNASLQKRLRPLSPRGPNRKVRAAIQDQLIKDLEAAAHPDGSTMPHPATWWALVVRARAILAEGSREPTPSDGGTTDGQA
jgi:CYTH domain-containing protein